MTASPTRWRVGGRRAGFSTSCAPTRLARNHAVTALGRRCNRGWWHQAKSCSGVRARCYCGTYGAAGRCWESPAGKRLVPMLAERGRCGAISGAGHRRGDRGAVASTSARRLIVAGRRASEYQLRDVAGRAGVAAEVRSRCVPGPLGRCGPGFVEIDLVFHDGGHPAGGDAFTLMVTDIATGWTENRWSRTGPANTFFAPR